MIAAGTYALPAPLVFSAADSGTAQAPVSYEATIPGTVTLSGGAQLVQRIAATKGLPATFDLPSTARNSWRGGGQLFVNGRRATLAREPKRGNYWFMRSAVALDSEPVKERGHEAFAPDPDAARRIAQLSATERSRAILQVMHSWTSSQHHISAEAAPAGSIRVTPRSHWAFLSTGTSQRYFIENVPSALNSPGEWVATESEVRYLPTEDQLGKKLEAILPALDHLMLIRGEAAGGPKVQHLSFRGLRFAHTRSLTPDTGFLDWQAAIGVGAAVEVDDAQHISFDRCEFSDTGGYGLWLRHSVQESQISRSVFNNLGAGGIQIGVAKEAKGEAAPTRKVTIEGNRIGHTGLLYPGAVGIWLAQGYDHRVANNLVHDTSYSGISVGWTWNFGPAASGGHQIVDNLLFNIGLAQMSDMGGIYTLGNLSGTVISGNLIREVRAYPGYGPGRGLGAWGIYNDLGSSSMVVENNVVLNTDSGAYHLNGGRDLAIRKNLFAGGGKGEIRVSRTTDSQPQATLTDNWFIVKADQLVDGPDISKELKMVDNQVASSTGAVVDLAQCGTGCKATKASIATGADAKAVQFQGLDSATAERLGRVLSSAGPGEAGTAGFKSATVALHTTSAVTAPPLAVMIDIQGGPVGSQPTGLTYRPMGDTQSIRLVEDSTAPGGRCLMFSDSPAFAHRYDPHAFARLNHESGTEVVEFSIHIDADTSFVHEWRDDDKPYKIGPSLRISAGGVTVSGKVVAPVTVGQWTQIRLTVPLGQPGAPWKLDVSDAGGKLTSTSILPAVSQRWRDLNALLFISDAGVVSQACLAGLKVANTPPRL